MRSSATLGLLDHRLVFVTGKGGVGKSTVAAAIGALAAAQGKRVVVAEVHRRADVEHAVLAAGAEHVSIDPQEAMEEYLVDQLPRPLAELLKSSRSFGYLAAATPGMTELLTAGKLWELARTSGARRARCPTTSSSPTRRPPATAWRCCRRRARSRARRWSGRSPARARSSTRCSRDPAQTAVVAVTTAEEMPVNETLTLCDGPAARRWAATRRWSWSTGCAPTASPTPRRPRMAAADGAHPALAAALSLHATAREQRAQAARLRRRLADGVPSVSLPFEPDGPDVVRLARRLERAA